MADPPPSTPLSLQNGRLVYKRRGLRAAPWSDVYHAILRASWTAFFAALVGTYVVANLLFAGLYLVGGDCIGSEDPTSFLEAFSFSVQTLSTIGYGGLSPTTPYAHVVMWVESFAGLVGVALATGMCFAKFARPEARVAFSSVAVVASRNGRPCLEFRMANERNSQIVDARLQLYLLYEDVTSEGGRMRRFVPLQLERDRSPVFLLSWTAMHFIDGDSPLAEVSEATLRNRMVSLIAIVSGVDATFVSNVHAQHYYVPEDIRFDHRFVDIMSFEDGAVIIDHARLDDVVPDEAVAVTDALPRGATR